MLLTESHLQSKLKTDQKQIPVWLASIQAQALLLAVAMKENNYNETENKNFTASKAGFIISEVNMNWLMLIYLVKLQTQIKALL